MLMQAGDNNFTIKIVLRSTIDARAVSSRCRSESNEALKCKTLCAAQIE